MFTPNAIPNKHTAKVKSNEKRPSKKLGCDFCISVEYKRKKKILFLGNTGDREDLLFYHKQWIQCISNVSKIGIFLQWKNIVFFH